MDFYLVLCYLLCWFLLSKINVARLTAKTIIDLLLASIVSKKIENILLDRMSVTRSTMSNQFGFKKKHGTDLCIYVLKEVIDRHRSLDGSMFTCFRCF